VRAGERILALETRDMAIFAMAKLAESRDSETGKHLERVRAYCGILAQYLSRRPEFEAQVNAEFVRTIQLTCPLHDIGKIGIPDAVLLKPGRLDDEEFQIMKTHAVIGSDTLQAAVRRYPNANYLRMAHDIARWHHERFDGKGYPDRLEGDEIPLAARITALADVYDALTTKRVYKEAVSHVVARNILLSESGKQFDPDLVEAYEACDKEFQQKRREIDRLKEE